MMTTKNMRLPPTATVVIHQTSKPSFLPITSTNTYTKKTPTSNKDLLSSQRPSTTRSIPGPYRKTSIISKPDFDLKIQSFHHHDETNNSSNE